MIRLACFNHFRRNIKQYLQEGLVDSNSNDEFQQKLLVLKERWKNWTTMTVSMIGFVSTRFPLYKKSCLSLLEKKLALDAHLNHSLQMPVRQQILSLKTN